MWKTEFKICWCLLFWNWLNFLKRAKQCVTSPGVWCPCAPQLVAMSTVRHLGLHVGRGVWVCFQLGMVWWLAMKRRHLQLRRTSPAPSLSCVYLPAVVGFVSPTWFLHLWLMMWVDQASYGVKMTSLLLPPAVWHMVNIPTHVSCPGLPSSRVPEKLWSCADR